MHPSDLVSHVLRLVELLVQQKGEAGLDACRLDGVFRHRCISWSDVVYHEEDPKSSNMQVSSFDRLHGRSWLLETADLHVSLYLCVLSVL